MKKTSSKKKPNLAHIAADLRPLAVPIESLRLDSKNARHHGEDNLAAICASLQRFGQLKPIVVNAKTNVVEAGNGTLEAARHLGWTHLAAVRVRHDAAAARGFALADNRTSELADWDDQMLEELLGQLRDDDQELYDALLFDQLSSGQPETDAEGSTEQSVPDKWALVIDCSGEAQQKQLYERLSKEGLSCRPLTL